jgi:hypothetical protein
MLIPRNGRERSRFFFRPGHRNIVPSTAIAGGWAQSRSNPESAQACVSIGTRRRKAASASLIANRETENFTPHPAESFSGGDKAPVDRVGMEATGIIFP